MASSYRPHAAPKRRALVASNIGALPLDPLYEILLRLPAKLLCRLRTVCRLWWSILSDPQLAAVHAKRHPGPLIIAALDEEHDVLVNIMDLSGQILSRCAACRVRESLARPSTSSVSRKSIASTAGTDVGTCFFGDLRYLPDQLLNPATGAVYRIPDGFAEEHGDVVSYLHSEPRYLFGQVSSTGEYKGVPEAFPIFPSVWRQAAV
ncbi:unnamed protein product [Miscanthus lutarioriparius]|uniref:F-box domain-containing protein n=1 Tax=Miscanthus lutarioriparius TaxID=422564 RepID=A0A811RKW9_9POAL|nr:unnamed protein product [Miscanthus lutarioriparius]